jgi:hypothetical protein
MVRWCLLLRTGTSTLKRHRYIFRDFDAPAVAGRPSDTSSATIAASGMLMLSRFEQSVSNTSGADYWANEAVRVSLINRLFV